MKPIHNRILDLWAEGLSETQIVKKLKLESTSKVNYALLKARASNDKRARRRTPGPKPKR